MVSQLLLVRWPPICSHWLALDRRAIDHPLELTDAEWEELYGELKLGAERRGLEFDPSPLRRFARYWKLQGGSVPDSIFPRGGRVERLRDARSTVPPVVLFGIMSGRL
jgi:hypothetical protein